MTLLSLEISKRGAGRPFDGGGGWDQIKWLNTKFLISQESTSLSYFHPGIEKCVVPLKYNTALNTSLRPPHPLPPTLPNLELFKFSHLICQFHSFVVFFLSEPLTPHLRSLPILFVLNLSVKMEVAVPQAVFPAADSNDVALQRGGKLWLNSGDKSSTLNVDTSILTRQRQTRVSYKMPQTKK